MKYNIKPVYGDTYTIEADNFKIDGQCIIFYNENKIGKEVNVHLLFQTDITSIKVSV